MRFEFDTQKLIREAFEKAAPEIWSVFENKELFKKNRLALRQEGLIAYFENHFYDYLELRPASRASFIQHATWVVRDFIHFEKVSKDEYLKERRILQTMCSYLEPLNPNKAEFYNEILPHIDKRGYVQLYRGICKKELAEFRAGNYGALGIWWATSIKTANIYGVEMRRKDGAILSWRVNVALLKNPPYLHRPDEVLINPTEVLNSGQCGKIKVLNRLQIALLLRVNKSQ